MMDLRITLGAKNGHSPRRLARFVYGDIQHTEVLDPYSGHDRQNVISRLATKLVIDRDRLASLDDEIVRAAEEGEAEEERFSLNSVSMADLDGADYRTNFLIDRLLVEGEPGVIGAAQKTLKTSIAWDMAISLAMGVPFLNHFEVPEAQKVLYLSGEGGGPFLQDVGRRVCQSKGLRLADVTGMRLALRLPQLDNAAHIHALRRECEASESSVVFYDPIYLGMSSADTNNLFAVGERLRAATEVCQDVGATLIVLHHTTRRRQHETPDDAPGLSDLAWAGFSEHAAQWFMLGRRSPYDEANPGLHKLVFRHGGRHGQSGAYSIDIDEGTIASGRYWHPTVTPLTEAKAQAAKAAEEEKARRADEKNQARLEDDKRRVCAALVKFASGETANVLKTAAGISGNRFNVAIASLIQDGDVVPCEVSKPDRKTPREGYRLAGEEVTHG